jgi:hypothetical protein
LAHDPAAADQWKVNSTGGSRGAIGHHEREAGWQARGNQKSAKAFVTPIAPKGTKISELKAIRDALPTRFSNTLAAAVKLLEPKAQAVSLPKRYDQERGRPSILARLSGRSDPREAQGWACDCVNHAK